MIAVYGFQDTVYGFRYTVFAGPAVWLWSKLESIKTHSCKPYTENRILKTVYRKP
ncbi:hypothetical protein [Larkinella ripae]